MIGNISNMINNKSNKLHSIEISSSDWGRLFFAFLAVMGLFGCLLSGFITYAAFSYTPVEASIAFICRYSEGINRNNYKISIKSENGNAPAPLEETVTLDESGKGEFRFHITEPGTYDYIIFQEKGSDEKIKYDDTKYDVHLFVTSDEDGKLEYSVSVNIADTDQKPTSVEFANKNANQDSSDNDSTDIDDKKELEEENPDTKSPTADDPDNNGSDNRDKGNGSPDRTDNPINAKTGDTPVVTYMIIVAIISMMGICILVYIKHRQSKEK